MLEEMIVGDMSNWELKFAWIEHKPDYHRTCNRKDCPICKEYWKREQKFIEE